MATSWGGNMPCKFEINASSPVPNDTPGTARLTVSATITSRIGNNHATAIHWNRGILRPRSRNGSFQINLCVINAAAVGVNMQSRATAVKPPEFTRPPKAKKPNAIGHIKA